MSKPIFYEGQAVGCLMYGEGVVRKVVDNESAYAIKCEFENDYADYTIDGKYRTIIRPTLYPIEQYRAIIANLPAPQPEKWKPKPGEWCLFWDDEFKFLIVLAKFKCMVNNKFETELNEIWDNCAPFTGELPEHLKEVKQ